MKMLTYASLVLLTGASLVLAADPAAACPEPTSGTGLATCSGTASTVEPTTTEGPVCWNAFCPGVESGSAPGTCAQTWLKGNGGDEVCVAVSLQPL